MFWEFREKYAHAQSRCRLVWVTLIYNSCIASARRRIATRYRFPTPAQRLPALSLLALSCVSYRAKMIIYGHNYIHCLCWCTPMNIYMNINLWMSTRRYTICNIFDTVVHSPAFKLRTVRPYLSITQTLERYACMHACMHVHACLCGCVCNACIVYIVYIQCMYCYSIHCLLYAMLELHI